MVLLAGCRRQAPPSTFDLSVPYELVELDPHLRNYAGSFALLSHIYEPLVITDAFMAMKPALAARWTNPDALTWVFTLQPDAAFHSGKPLIAADVVFSIERLLEGPRLQMSDNVVDVASLKALDEKTVELKTKRPTSILLGALRFVAIVPKGFDPAAAPNGTGPYRMAAFKKGELLELERNEAYWGPKPALPRVAFHLRRSPEQAISDLWSGKFGLVQCNSKALETAVQQAPEFELKRRASVFVKYLGLNTRQPGSPWLDPRVRRALHLGIDRERLTKELSTFAVPASQPVSPFVFGFNPQLKVPAYQPEEARKLLREAGLPNGFDVPMTARTMFKESAEKLREQLSAIGIRATVTLVQDHEYFDFQQKMKAEPILALTRIGCPTGDAQTMLTQVLHSAGAFNPGATNPALDAKIEASARMLNMETRRRILEETLDLAMRDLAIIPLYMDEDVYALRKPNRWQPRNDSYIYAWEIETKGK